METSIDEGIEAEGEAEEDPAQAFAALQATRCGKRRHTLSEVTNQLVGVPGTRAKGLGWGRCADQQLPEVACSSRTGRG